MTTKPNRTLKVIDQVLAFAAPDPLTLRKLKEEAERRRFIDLVQSFTMRPIEPLYSNSKNSI